MRSTWAKASVPILITFLLGTFAGQNRSTLQQLYGSPIDDAYHAPNDLKVSAQFAVDGGICEASIEAVRGKMTDKQLDPVLDAIAPSDTRGQHKMDTFLIRNCLPDFECAGVTSDYKHLRITKIGNTNAYSSAMIEYRRHGCKALNKQ